MRPKYLAWLFGLTAIWQVGCTRPCDSTSQCGDTEMCVASTCQALTCERTIFARNPVSGECTPLSGCFLTEEQRTWLSCDEDPCVGREESSCITDSRCQPFYQNPNVQPRKRFPIGGDSSDVPPVAECFGGRPTTSPDFAAAPGVNNGETPKYPTPETSCSFFDNSARAYVGCRPAPRIEKQPSCESLARAACTTRRDCTTDPSGGSSGSGGGTVDLPAPAPSRDASGTATVPFLGECFSRFERPATTCSGSSAAGCLMNASCQAIGSQAYCPPGSSCEREGGDFLGCESNDRLRRCSSSAECGSDERCDNDEACIQPRTFAAASTDSGTKPGSPSCLGACVPKGCTGMGERMCNDRPECDGGTYGTVCKPKPYCVGGGSIPESPETDPATGGGNCGCEAEFTGCAATKPLSNLRVERSLLVRDPEIIDDPAFRIDSTFTKLAPAGRVDDFTNALLSQVGAQKTLPVGSITKQREGYKLFLIESNSMGAGVTSRLAGLMHPTALINRIDLVKPGTCGEARLTYALTRAYTDGNQRMTLIIELRVPDDGNGCKTVAQRWGELSLIDDISERRTRLIALYNDLLKPENVGQIRTNEFLNRTGKEPWELREFHLNNGLPELAPVAQTVDKRFLATTAFKSWMQQNGDAFLKGNATIPETYLAASSTEDGGRLRFSTMGPSYEKALNEQACAGCHLTETKSPFVHIGERLGKSKGPGLGYAPIGRAVIDSFLQKELVTRAQNLQFILSGQRLLIAPQQTGLARVH